MKTNTQATSPSLHVILRMVSRLFNWRLPASLSFFIFFTGCGIAQAQEVPQDVAAQSFSIKQASGQILPMKDVPADAKRVSVGIYAVNVYDLDIRSNTYRLSAYLWLRWKGDFDPVASLEFTNVVENWGLTNKNLLESPRQLADGSNYQEIRIEGRFFNPFDLRRYPLDKQELALTVESSTDTYQDIVFVPDRDSSGYSNSMVIPGWRVSSLNAQSYIHDYGTNFGETGSGSASKYSMVKFSFPLERQINFFVWKMLLPLLIVLLTNWFALVLNPIYIEVRTAMPATALLTTVLIRQSALDAIPECPTLVLMDQIYVLAYFFIVLTLIQVIWVNTKLNKESPESIARMIRIDKRSFVAQIIGFSAMLGLLLWLV